MDDTCLDSSNSSDLDSDFCHGLADIGECMTMRWLRSRKAIVLWIVLSVAGFPRKKSLDKAWLSSCCYEQQGLNDRGAQGLEPSFPQ